MFLVYICEFKIAVNRENTPQVLNLCLPFTGASLNMDAKVKAVVLALHVHCVLGLKEIMLISQNFNHSTTSSINTLLLNLSSLGHWET